MPATVLGEHALTLPVGTLSQRPTPVEGMLRMNTTLNMPEWYDATHGRWNLVSDLTNTYAVEYLIVGGGGGGGGRYYSGGGGGGGVVGGVFIVQEGFSYTVTVGAGGGGGTSDFVAGFNGQPSLFGNIIVPGGGGGGSYSVHTYAEGRDGACGGGSSGYEFNYNHTGRGMCGYHGAKGGLYGGGGGGGAGGDGLQGASAAGGAGGPGRASSITGTSVTLGGGGGGGAYTTTGGAGGVGGGGAGSGSQSGGVSINGTATLGGGGGGAQSNLAGGSGGSGRVIIKYYGSIQLRGAGGTIITTGGHTVHIFNSSGTFIG